MYLVGKKTKKNVSEARAHWSALERALVQWRFFWSLLGIVRLLDDTQFPAF
jgi:hypothetical protein